MQSAKMVYQLIRKGNDNQDHHLSYDVAPIQLITTCLCLIQWITICHKNHMTTYVLTLWHIHVTSLKMLV